MKQIIMAALAILVAAQCNAQVQLSPSSEPRPTFDKLTGAAIIMPVIIRHDAPKLAAVTGSRVKPIRIRNRAQMRTAKADSTRNGYYPGMGNRNWGTSMRLNHFWFLPPSPTGM